MTGEAGRNSKASKGSNKLKNSVKPNSPLKDGLTGIAKARLRYSSCSSDEELGAFAVSPRSRMSRSAKDNLPTGVYQEPRVETDESSGTFDGEVTTRLPSARVGLSHSSQWLAPLPGG